MYKKIYAVYDLQEILLFTGTSTECCEFINCKYKTFISAVERNSVINKTYRVAYLYDEKVQERTCVKCKKTFPAHEMYQRKRKSDGTYYPSSRCDKCHLEYLKERRRKKK